MVHHPTVGFLQPTMLNGLNMLFKRMVHLGSMPNALRIRVPETHTPSFLVASRGYWWRCMAAVWSRHSSMSLRLLFLRLNIQNRNLHVFSIWWQSGYQMIKMATYIKSVIWNVEYDGKLMEFIWIRWLTCWAGVHRIFLQTLSVFSQDCAGLCKHACFG